MIFRDERSEIAKCLDDGWYPDRAREHAEAVAQGSPCPYCSAAAV
jgi:hypothetical protein